jgi:hypothetical protein
MKKLNYYRVESLDQFQKTKIRAGNPIVPVLAVIGTIISTGKAMDKATEWFLEGWNNPN